MPQTLQPTSEAAARAITQVESLNKRLNHLLTFVPDDKLAWAPSSTSKSCLRVAAHCAVVNTFFANSIAGKVLEPMPTPHEFFEGLDQAERKITTRQAVTRLVNETAAELLEALRGVSAENMNASPDSPFGPLPMEFWLHECAEHLAHHVGQVEYLQTIWGDLDNHMG